MKYFLITINRTPYKFVYASSVYEVYERYNPACFPFIEVIDITNLTIEEMEERYAAQPL